MKNVMRILCAAMLLVSFAACTEKENGNDNPGGGSDNNTSALILGTWRVDQMSVDGRDMTPEHMTLSFYEGGHGLMNDGGVTEHNDFTWSFSGDVISINTGHSTFTFTIDNLTATECSFHGDFIEFGGQEITGDLRFHMTKTNGGDNPGDTPDLGDLGVSMVELSESTAHSLTVRAFVTGSVSQYLGQFPNRTCGFVWCPAYDGAPTMSNNVVDCDMGDNDNWEGTINVSEAGAEYNVAAWVRFTPDSEPVIGDWRTFRTEEEGQANNWITLNSAMAAGSTSISVTVTAYFDSNPRVVGVVYSTGTTPTISDNVYDAFEHLNMETGEHDETIQRVMENADGSRTVAALLTNLQPNTTYRLRAFFKLPDGSVTYSDEELTVTTEAGK